MSDTAESESRLSKSEVENELLNMSPADWARAQRLANFLSRSLTDVTGDDLLQETMTKLLSQDRVWKRGLEPILVLFVAMRGISSNDLKKEMNGPVDPFKVVSTTDEEPEDAGREHFEMGVSHDTPEVALIKRQLLEQIEADVSQDEDAHLLLLMWIDGIRGAEAATELGMDAKRYDAARKRLARRLAPYEMARMQQ
jgi:DNA-directed RNA polymerase specialized sigma24 family protein